MHLHSFFTGAVYEYEYDDCYRLVKENIVDGDISKVIEYTYDNMYNRISKTEDGTVTVYEYDANNRLIRQGEEALLLIGSHRFVHHRIL